MTGAHLRTAAIALLALLAFPRAGSAGIFDIIWEMSGPQMVSVFLLQCEFDLVNDQPECLIYDKRVWGPQGVRADRRWSLSFDGALYTSTGKNSDTHRFEKFKSQMVAVEPMLTYRSYRSSGGNFSTHHGLLGASYNVLFGDEFDTFHKGGFKFTPIRITAWKRINAAYHLRVYPDGFTAEEFGAESLVSTMHPGRELVHGFSVGVYFDLD